MQRQEALTILARVKPDSENIEALETLLNRIGEKLDTAVEDGTIITDRAQESGPAEYFSQQRRRSWARLLRKIYEVDPLKCSQWDSRLQIIAVIQPGSVIREILQHLDLWGEPQRAPPPQLLPHKLERFLASLSSQQAQAVRASSDSPFWDEVPDWPN